jgi:hypothetical protein
MTRTSGRFLTDSAEKKVNFPLPASVQRSGKEGGKVSQEEGRAAVGRPERAQD